MAELDEMQKEFNELFLKWSVKFELKNDLRAAFMSAFETMPFPHRLKVIRLVSKSENLHTVFGFIKELVTDIKIVSLLDRLLIERDEALKVAPATIILPAQVSAGTKPAFSTPVKADDPQVLPVSGAPTVLPASRSRLVQSRPPIVREDASTDAAEAATAAEPAKPEKKGWLDGLKEKASAISLPKLPKKDKSSNTFSSPKTSRFKSGSSFSSGGGLDVTSKIKERWQIFAIGLVAILFILFISFLGPISGGHEEVLSTGAPIDKVPVIAFFTLLILVPLFLEANSRGDISDAIFVLVSVVLSSTANVYKDKWSTLMAGNVPLGTYFIGFLFFAPYLIMIMSAVTNRTRNVFARRIFSKLDFSPVYMTMLIFWALAKTHVYWDWVPNPCFLPENFYLNGGILFLILELSGNFVNLAIALVAGISSGYLMFDPTYFYIVFIIYMAVMGYASTDWATKEMTMNVDAAPSTNAEGGTSFGRGVQSKRFVPYDLLAGALWFTAITVVILKGNPAFPFNLPF